MKSVVVFLLPILFPFLARGQALRYWFDGDEQSAQYVVVSDSTVNLDIDISSLSDYIHALHMQARNADGAWGGVTTRYFVKLPASQNPDINVGTPSEAVALRYWYDGDMKNAREVGVLEGVVNIDADISSLSDYIHALHMQGRNADGAWGGVMTRYFVKLPASQNPDIGNR